MNRIEIIANKSVESDIIDSIESSIPDLRYTLISEACGKGKRDKKLGTVTWPEMNFVLFSYVDEETARMLGDLISGIKRRFPNEGIVLFVTGGAARGEAR
jgi:hypothetical protein